MDRYLAVSGILLLGTLAVAADIPSKPDPSAPDLQSRLADLHIVGADFWIYNNLEGAIAEARRSNKPIFVTFRCVPCKACAGFDAEVAKGSDVIARLAREKFVSLRQVEMKGVDLNQFQFDYDLNWAAMFINADGTVYARYGTQSIDGPDAFNSIASLETTMNRVLELHARFNEVRPSLAGKRGAEKPYAAALQMPGMEDKDKLAQTTQRNNCIHCHMIHDAEQRQWSRAGEMTPEKLYRFPLPDNLGLHIARDDGRLVEKVAERSAAARAGLKAGDQVTHLNGQPILSIADMQWVLHNLGAGAATIDVAYLREGAAGKTTLTTQPGWKKIDFKWRGSRWSLRPEPGFWGPAAKPAELKGLAIPEGAAPIRVQWINVQRPEGKNARDAGLREGDILITLDDKPLSMTPEQFQMSVRLERKAGDVLKLGVLRNGKPVEVRLKLMD